MNRDAAPGSSARAHFGIGAPVAGVIGLAAQGRPRAALALADRVAASDAEGVHPARLAAARALARFIAADFDSAAEQGEVALQLCDERASEQPQRQEQGPADPLTRALAVAARLLASAGTPWAGVDPRSDERLAAELIDAVPPLAGTLSPSERPYAASLIVEALFDWPGLSSLLVSASFSRDYPVIQGSLIAIFAIFILISLLIDLAQSFFDPRVRAPA